MKFCSILAYADDTTIFCSEKKLDLVLASLEYDAMQLVQWFRANKLSLNANKTEFQLFVPYAKTSKKISITVDGIKIENSKTCKLLGILIDA